MKAAVSIILGVLAAVGLVALAPPASPAQPLPKVLPAVGSTVEGDLGANPTVLVPVSLSAPSEDAVTVQWETWAMPPIDPSVIAEPGVDYTAASGTVTFAANDTDETVSITVTGDEAIEPDELIVVRFHSPTNAVIGGFFGLGVGVIENDDVPPPPSITVTPNTGLDGGDLVTVTGANWPPGASVGVCQGDAQLADPPEDGCRSGTGGIAQTVADSNGEFSVDYRLLRWNFIPARGFIDCTDPATPCVMGAAQIIGGGPVPPFASVPLDFADPPPPPGTLGQITVDPATDVVDGDTLTVTGSGFRADAVIELHPCVATAAPPNGCDYAKRVNAVADGSGSFVQSMPAHRYLYGTGVDCVFRDCVVGAGEAVDVPGTFVTTALAFAPPVPAVRPMVGSVVEGDGAPATVVVPVSLSEPTPAEVTVQWEIIAMPQVDPALRATPGVDFVNATGTVTFAPEDTDEVVSIEVLGDEIEEQDELIVLRFHSPTSATLNGFYALGAGVIIDDDEPPPPSITVTPGTGLNGGDVVTITGSHWPPGAAVGACQAADVVGDPPESACLSGQFGAVTTTADGDGSWSVPYRLRRQGHVAALGEWVDCTDGAVPCVMGAAQIVGGVPTDPSAIVPLSFAEPPPPPATRGSITVVPSTDLVDGQALTVTGTGFRASAAIEIHACLAPVTAQTRCAWTSVVDVDADGAGAFTATVPARQLLFGEHDCATRACALAVFEAVDFEGTVVTAPVSFATPL